MSLISAALIAGTSLTHGTQRQPGRAIDTHQFSFPTQDKAPVLKRGYVRIGRSLFVPKGRATAVPKTIYQSKNGKGYAVKMADRRLAPVKILAEVPGNRRVFGLAREWHLTSDGEHGFTMKRAGGGTHRDPAAPTGGQAAMAKRNPRRCAHRSAAGHHAMGSRPGSAGAR